MRIITTLLIVLFSSQIMAADYLDYASGCDEHESEAKPEKKSRKTTPFNNWNDSIRRWSRGKGAWDNWRKWRKPSKDNPWATFDDAVTDFRSDFIGDMATDMDFNIWIKMNMDADSWFKMRKQDKHKVYNYWKHEVEPYYDYYEYHENAPGYSSYEYYDRSPKAYDGEPEYEYYETYQEEYYPAPVK